MVATERAEQCGEEVFGLRRRRNRRCAQRYHGAQSNQPV
jgi:hypothetical protein